MAPVEDLDDPGARQIEVDGGITAGAVREVVEREEEDEGAVDARGVEGLQQLTEIGGLAGLVAGVLAVQPDRRAVLVVLDDLQTAGAPFSRAW